MVPSYTVLVLGESDVTQVQNERQDHVGQIPLVLSHRLRLLDNIGLNHVDGREKRMPNTYLVHPNHFHGIKSPLARTAALEPKHLLLAHPTIPAFFFLFRGQLIWES